MKKIFFSLRILVLFLGIMSLNVSGTGNVARAQFFFQNPLVGQPAPDFTLKMYDGNKVNMTKLRDNKSAIIFFWATWCPHCRESLEGLNQNLAQIQKKGIKIILVDLGESEREVRAYVERNKVKVPIFLDEESSLAENYGIIGVPTFFFVDPKGVVKAVEHSVPENYEEILLPKDAKASQENQKPS